jgi:hypothetical protein
MDLRRRNWTAPDPSSEVPINLILNTLHHNERSYDVSPSDGPRTRLSDFLFEHVRPPAIRRLAFEVAHKPLTTAQPPLPRPLVLGSSTVVT